MDIKKKVKISDLLNLYGKLLSDHQYEMLNLYYNLDISLVEIADRFNISRQGAYDAIKNGEKSLIQYEEKIGLLKKISEIEGLKNFKKEEVLTILSKER